MFCLSGIARSTFEFPIASQKIQTARLQPVPE